MDHSKNQGQKDTTKIMKVLTFNCWAINYVPFVTKDRKQRVTAIAQYLAKETDAETKDSIYDLVCLQELWTKADRNLIKEACKKSLPYSAEFHGGVVGSGTMILSKWPILETKFKKFSLNGYMHEFWHGDAFAAKGIGMAKLMIGSPKNPFIVNAYVSHYHAEYSRVNDAYATDRVVQALEAGDFIEMTSQNTDAILYCGDFNTEPGDLPHRVLTQYYNLKDSQSHLAEKLKTCYAKENSYRSCDGEKNPREITIDYVMYQSLFNSKVCNLKN